MNARRRSSPDGSRTQENNSPQKVLGQRLRQPRQELEDKGCGEYAARTGEEQTISRKRLCDGSSQEDEAMHVNMKDRKNQRGKTPMCKNIENGKDCLARKAKKRERCDECKLTVRVLYKISSRKEVEGHVDAANPCDLGTKVDEHNEAEDKELDVCCAWPDQSLDHPGYRCAHTFMQADVFLYSFEHSSLRAPAALDSAFLTTENMCLRYQHGILLGLRRPTAQPFCNLAGRRGDPGVRCP
jgi:hypothetical protein